MSSSVLSESRAFKRKRELEEKAASLEDQPTSRDASGKQKKK
jgi:hypothetical protein